jgi:hypothetical protein
VPQELVDECERCADAAAELTVDVYGVGAFVRFLPQLISMDPRSGVRSEIVQEIDDKARHIGEVGSDLE